MPCRCDQRVKLWYHYPGWRHGLKMSAVWHLALCSRCWLDFIAMAIGDRPALAVGFVGGMIASQGKSGFLGALAAGFIAGYLILALRKACEKSSRGTGKDCSGPDLPGCGCPAHRTGYELRRRAGHGRDQYGVKQWSEQHGWFE